MCHIQTKIAKINDAVLTGRRGTRPVSTAPFILAIFVCMLQIWVNVISALRHTSLVVEPSLLILFDVLNWLET